MLVAMPSGAQVIRQDRLGERAPPLAISSTARRPNDLVGFWLPTCVLFAIACLGAERWRALFASLPTIVRTVLAPPIFIAHPLAVYEASVFLACLVWLLWRHRTLFRNVARALRGDDWRQAFYVIIVLELLSLATRPSSLGIDYEMLSLTPFGQDTGIFNRRILDVAAAYYTHLNGGLFVVFHFLTVFALLALVRAYLRRLGAEPSFLVFVSLAGSSFIIFNFQYVGYPDPLVLLLVLCALLAELELETLLFLVVLALLTHEALATALFLPLLCFAPRRLWPVLALPFAIYGVLWIVDFHLDPVAGWTRQIHFQGLSGPEAVAQRPLVVLFGILAGYKLLWLVIGDQLAFTALRCRPSALGRLAAPLVGMAAICVLSYDTSRMAEVGFLTLLWSWPGWIARWSTRAVLAVAAANFLIPSVYVTPYFNHPLGVIWPPGLYSAYHGFRSDTVSIN